METKTITIELTPDELETLGDGLELSIRMGVKHYQKESIGIMCNEHISLLRDLINVGYSIYLVANESLENSRHCYDVDKFIDYLYYEKNRAEAQKPQASKGTKAKA